MLTYLNKYVYSNESAYSDRLMIKFDLSYHVVWQTRNQLAHSSPRITRLLILTDGCQAVDLIPKDNDLICGTRKGGESSSVSWDSVPGTLTISISPPKPSVSYQIHSKENQTTSTNGMNYPGQIPHKLLDHLRTDCTDKLHAMCLKSIPTGRTVPQTLPVSIRQDMRTDLGLGR